MTLIENMLSVNGVAFLMFCIFAIAAIGYGLGRITIKGVNLGTAGVFIVALLFGCFFFEPLKAELMVGEVAYVDNALKIIETFGLTALEAMAFGLPVIVPTVGGIAEMVEELKTH